MTSEVISGTTVKCVCAFSFPGFSQLGSARGVKYLSNQATFGERCFAVKIYPGGGPSATEGNMSCYLHNPSSKHILCSFKLDLMAGETVAQTCSSINEPIEPYISSGWHNFALRSYVLDPANHVLSADCLIIRATVTFITPCESLWPAPPACVKSTDCYLYKTGSDTALAGSLLALHDSESGSHDFTIIVKAPATASEGKPEHAENRISTHKFILAARSPVLRAMLSSGMQEANADEMEITGYAVDAVSAFVRFLYCDVCAEEALKEHAWELIAMADKYDVAALRFVCETYLAEHLLPGNAVTTLQRADLHNAPVLKRKALEYIAQHKTALSENPAVLDGMSYELLREVVLAQAK